MARMILLFFVSICLTAAQAAETCTGQHCADEKTSGPMMLQMQSKRGTATTEDVDQEDMIATSENDQDPMDLQAEDLDEDEEDELDDADLALLAEQDEEEEEEGRRPKRGKGRRSGKGRKPVLNEEDRKSCPGGGKKVGESCWHVAPPSTSCDETCNEKDLQYDEATELGTPTVPKVQEKCLAIAQQLGFPGKISKIMDNSWSSQGCGCTVYLIAAYGNDDTVRLKRGGTNAKCAKTATISSRICACKAGVAKGGNCTQDSQCSKGYCNSGKCMDLLSSGESCTAHSSCATSYCDASNQDSRLKIRASGKCSTLAWRQTMGALALSYRKSGAKRLQPPLKMPAGVTWEAATKFSSGFCLGYYAKTTGCLVARGIDKKKTIAMAQSRCAQSEECRSVWCCATGCPATTCYATKIETPNLRSKDCPDAPGSFGETKYPNTMYIKDDGRTPQPEQEEEAPEAPEEEVPEAPEAPEAPEEAPEVDEEQEPDTASFKVAKKGAICRHGRKKVEGAIETVEKCSEAVRQQNGMGFLFIAKKKRCMHQPKLSDCKKVKRSKIDYYELNLDIEEDEVSEDE